MLRRVLNRAFSASTLGSTQFSWGVAPSQTDRRAFGASMQTGLSASRDQGAMHNINVHVALFWMAESIGQFADGFKPELPPKADRGRIRGNHKIELHRAKTKPARFAQAMLGH